MVDCIRPDTDSVATITDAAIFGLCANDTSISNPTFAGQKPVVRIKEGLNNYATIREGLEARGVKEEGGRGLAGGGVVRFLLKHRSFLLTSLLLFFSSSSSVSLFSSIYLSSSIALLYVTVSARYGYRYHRSEDQHWRLHQHQP